MKDVIYDHTKIEEKWQQIWEDQALFQDSAGSDPVDKLYLLFAFAYPSGSGLHVGHVESKTALDILARFNRMKGKDVFFPVGWDAFGLPAENYAIKTGVPPATTTQKAMDTFKRQLKRIGISYDWANEIATCRPDYYQWTQWLFVQLYKAGLAYQAEGKVNWCPSCQTVLANEQVVNGLCERCDHEVTQKEMKQWYFKITDYQDELIDGLEGVDWPEPTKQQQKHWIGKSVGINISFEIIESDKKIEVFTTAPVNWGASFIVLAPDHKLVEELTTGDQKKEVLKYLKYVQTKSDSDRIKSNDKTGVFTGSYALNHVTKKQIPIWIGDFVLSHVGTGAIQACPGHDLRDFEFAKKFGISIPRVVVGVDGDESPIERPAQVVDKTMPGKMTNSDFLDGMSYQEGLQKTMDYFEEKGWGKRVNSYRLRDWLISRQRYWGAPIPIIYDPAGQPHLVEKRALPWKLAEDVDFKPTGESPLRSSKEFLERTQNYAKENFADLISKNGWDENGAGWTPEYDTMDTFVDSSWYYLRYPDAHNEQEFASTKQLQKWLPIDFYMIGPEHIVLHLLYSRFFTKFLADQGYLNFREPFMKMRHQGMILGPDGKKMSKSKGNVINPDDIVEKFGADTLRVYEMFMGPIEADKPWDDRSVVGIHRFLRRIYDLASSFAENKSYSSDVERKLHQTIKKVSEDIPNLKFNTAIASMMEFLNDWEQAKTTAPISKENLLKFVRILAPFAPFVADELWHKVGDFSKEETVHQAQWPKYDPDLAQDQIKRIPVQVNGRLRDKLVIDVQELEDLSEGEVFKRAQKLDKIGKWLEGKQPKKQIYVPGKIVNFVI